MIEIQETSWYSDRLGREMPVKRYGTKGKPCLVIPSQDGKHNDFESFGMVEACRPFIENGRLQLFCVDTIDAETWSCTWKNPRDRIFLHEKWMQYLFCEVLPFMKQAAPGQLSMTMALYRRSHMYFCVGQGAWEDELLADTRKLDSVLKAKGIPAFVDYWGYDVSHDWCWWQKQAAYFLGKIL